MRKRNIITAMQNSELLYVINIFHNIIYLFTCMWHNMSGFSDYRNDKQAAV